MRIVVAISFFGLATAALVGYDYQPLAETSADLPFNTDYPNVGSLELNTFAPNSGMDSYGFDTQADDDGLNKEFYHYSAPEEELQSSDASEPAVASIRKNLRVLFIKTPENNGIAKAALRLAKQATSDRTAIYVLSKHADASEFAKELKQLRSSINYKPEVRFVKYRTPEDAHNAQTNIQRQYEALRGPSRSINEGIAPVLDFSSAPLIVQAPNVAREDTSSSTSYSSPSEELRNDREGRGYIPPIS